MKHVMVFGIVMLWFLAGICADEAADLNAARGLVAAGKQEEALATFTRLAETASGDAQKSVLLNEAAQCAQRLKKYDQAMELARKIPVAPMSKTVQMQIMLENGKAGELVAAFKDENIARWPQEMQGDGHYARGQAFYRTKDGVRAEADLTRAAAMLLQPQERVLASALLADTYRTLLKDDTRALAAYREARQRARSFDRWGYMFFTASATAADMLATQGKYAEALEVLNQANVDSLDGYWRSYLLNAYASVYAAQGRLVDAITALDKSLDIQGLPAEHKAGIEKQMGNLLAKLADPGTHSVDLVLAVNGRTDYQIVIPDACPDADIGAALTNIAALIQHAFLTNGFKIAVVPERERDPARPGLFLGDTAFARDQGVDLTTLGDWGYRHKAIGRNVVITGRDRTCPIPPPPGGWRDRTHGQPELGTIKAASDFLRQYAGVRFLYPGAAGIEFLRQPVIAVPKGLDTAKTSAVQFNCFYFQRNEPYFIANNYLFPLRRAFANWESSIPAEKYRETHPEYFALVNGRRCCLEKDWTGKWAEQYCLSNPDVRELIYHELLNQADRGLDVVSMNHPDGFQACQCEECRKLYGTGDNWCEKVWIFYRGMAERLWKERPDKKVEFYSYGPTCDPPKTFCAFPGNTSIMLCSTTPESFADWKRCRVPGGFSAYLYNWGSWQQQACMPKRTATYVAAQVKNFYSNHVNGVSIDGFGESYGLDGPSYYVYGRMFDNPESNQAVSLMDEFCTAAFREGAAPMKRFFAELHHALESSYLATRYQDHDGRWRPALDDPLHYFTYVYPPDRLAAMEGHLAQAESLAVSDNARRRLTLVRLEFDVLKSTVTVIQFYNAYRMRPDYASRESLLRTLDERNALIDALFVRTPAGNPGSKKSIPGWPEMTPFDGCGRDMIGLYDERHRASYRGLFEMNTAAMRQAPLPGTKRLNVKPAAVAVTLDSPSWETAAPETLACLPDGKSVVALKTSLKALRDQANLYLRIESDLPGAEMNFTPVGRDGEVNKQESLDICIDPYGQREKFYRFIVGPLAGSKYDARNGLIVDQLHPLYGKDDPAWNGNWAYETRLEPEKNRWLVMLAIPFQTLGVEPPAAGTIWRGNVVRVHLAGTNRVERSTWSPVSGSKEVTDKNAFGEINFEK